MDSNSLKVNYNQEWHETTNDAKINEIFTVLQSAWIQFRHREAVWVHSLHWILMTHDISFKFYPKFFRRHIVQKEVDCMIQIVEE